MRTDTGELYKSRIIQFCRFHPEPEQAYSAARWLREIAGIESVWQASPLAVEVVYDLRQVTLECIECALTELGYHLDNSLLCKLKRALFYYTEDTQRENLAITQECQITQQEVFINRYQHLTHGCRDPQPEYWREYQ
ncbi:MAG: hypothetical protein KDJ31_05880 [Candidatus Competibacteraceae bacterium]|nr:hypothetical protein [Candidatus Competibacteraceae bacterium]MCB1821295.1 hypothetical protein [Candidatus Competibacteraceae bacterium]HRY15340.1 hypothetical protein [Candidatus Competibacteraceae bacterium]